MPKLLDDPKNILEHYQPEPEPASKPYLDKCIAIGGEEVACHRHRQNKSLLYLVGKHAIDVSEPTKFSASLLIDDPTALYIFFNKKNDKPVACFPMDKDSGDEVFFNRSEHDVRVVRMTFQDKLKLDKETFLKDGFSSGLTYDSLGKQLGKLWKQYPHSRL